MRKVLQLFLLVIAFASVCIAADYKHFAGTVVDEKGDAVAGLRVRAEIGGKAVELQTDRHGQFAVVAEAESVAIRLEGNSIEPTETVLVAGKSASITVRYRIEPVKETLVITSSVVDPSVERRNDAVYKNTLFNRDDQIFDTLASGINAGQHEGGGKSIEVRRFGYNLDHGGVAGGLKILVEDVQQNQSTQGHGQGYLGQLKSLTPELVEDVEILNGPFSAEYGDFSGLGVVHIRLKQRLENRLTARVQGGSFGALRTFVAYSPRWDKVDSYIAYEGARTDGPFINPLRYRRDNFTSNFTRHLDAAQTLGFRFNAARNNFESSGQIPLDEVAAGRIDRFGYVDPDDGGKNRNATAALYYKRDFSSGDALRADVFVTRNLFDLWSNFTFHLNDPTNGDEILQHDSRLQQGANVQWLHASKLFGKPALLTAGTNFHDNQINVGMFHTAKREVISAASDANAHVTNGAWYAQQSIDFEHPHVHVDVGLRYDVFRFALEDRLATGQNGTYTSGALQPKVNVAWTPARKVPVTLHTSYGRGISSQDARGIVQYPNGPKLATTDFYQIGTSTQLSRFSLSTDWFVIDRSNEQVYVPDDGSTEFRGPSRSYGWEAKSSVQLLKHLSWNAGITQVSNAFYRGTAPREYVDSAPHTVLNSGVTLAGWRGIYSSVRYRHISGYIVDPVDRSERATGADVLDFAMTKSLWRGLEANFAIDNLTNHRYYETQNWFESKLSPTTPAAYRIHATPGYPIGYTVGLTFRWE